MRRIALIVLLLPLAALASPAAAGAVQTAQTATAASPAGLRADFNNDGFADLAVGVPGEDDFAGAVNVLYGGAAGLSGTGSQLLTQVGSSPESGDFFGSALATGDFNNDGFADLAAGAPWEDVFSTIDAGSVSVFYGSATGLTRTGGTLFTQVGSSPEFDDWFGWALSTGDFNHDGYADLAAAAPFEDVISIPDGGAVSVLYGSASGLSSAGGKLFTQLGSAAEPGDTFGYALTSGDLNHDGFADLAAAAPFEDVISIPDGGAVSVLPGSAAGLTTAGGKLFTQVGSPVEAGDSFGFALTAGDFNNDSFVDLAAGAPQENAGSVLVAGAITVVYGSATGVTTAGGRTFTQVAGVVEAFDEFGYALTAGDFNNDGFVDVVAGAPAEDVLSTVEAGSVSAVYGSATGLTTSGGQQFTQVGSSPEPGDWFGGALTAGDFNNDGFADLAAGAPFEDVFSTADAGAVSVLRGSAARLTTAGGQIFTQDSPGVAGVAEPTDFFGLGLGADSPTTASATTSSASGARSGTGVRGAVRSG